MPRKHDQGPTRVKIIQPGDSGIWATCNKGRERACISELQDLFAEYAETLYGDAIPNSTVEGAGDETETPGGIESEIQAEIAELHEPGSMQLFTPARVEVQCGKVTCSER